MLSKEKMKIVFDVLKKQHLIKYKLLILMIQELIIIFVLFTIRLKIAKSAQIGNLVKIVKVLINYFMIINYVLYK